MKKINWLDHIANLLVVVLGISIAFYLDEYSNEKNQEAQEQKYLAGLITDLEADMEALDTLIQVNEMILEATISLTQATASTSNNDPSKLRNDILTIQYNPPFVPQRTIYESMKASGKMELIDDFELRSSLIELYEQYYRGTAQYDQALDDHVRDFIKPFIIHKIQFTNNGVGESFLNETSFKNMIFTYRYLFAAKNEFYKEVLKNVEKVKTEIQSQNNSG